MHWSSIRPQHSIGQYKSRCNISQSKLHRHTAVGLLRFYRSPLRRKQLGREKQTAEEQQRGEIIAGNMVFKTSSSSELLPAASESTPLLPTSQHDKHPLSSSKRTFVNVVITIVGASVLSLPYAFKCVGWLGGTIILTLTGLATYYCMILLVWSKRKLERDGDCAINSFGDLGFHTFGTPGRTAVDLLVVISQAGFCIGYLIFISDTLASILSTAENDVPTSGTSRLTKISQVSSSGFLGISWDEKPVYVWIVFPFQVALAAIRSVTHLAPLSLFADVADILGVGVVMGKEMLTLRGGIGDVDAFKTLANVPFVVGVGIYAFEGIAMVFTLEGAMKHSHKFGGVLGLAFLSIICLYSSFGVLGYLAFGEGTQQIITQNLGRSTETVLVKLALCSGLFFAFPLMMSPVYEIVERRLNKGKSCLWLRALIVFVTCIIGVAVPNFTDYLSLAGSSFCCLLVFLFPASMYLVAFGRDCSWFLATFNCLLIIFGTAFGVVGTIDSLKKMI